MDALSALKMMVSSQSGTPLSNNVQDVAASVAKSIPSTELQTLNSDVPVQSATAASGSSGAGFENFLGNMVGEVAQKQATANDAVSGLLSGKNVSLHQTMISIEEANLSFQMMVEVRNKLLDSYQELMRMQI
jgi:flagellar hook-basal body complex protein FliE